jgi:transglutaminase-like putative cysteine protease
MLLRVEHTFAFGYDGYISESFLELRVQPKPTPTQTVASFSLAVGPPTRVFRYRDWNDNLAHHFTVTKFHDRIEITSRSLVETKAPAVALAAVTETPARETAWSLHDYLDFGGPVRASAALRDAHRAVKVPRTAPLGEQVAAIGAHLHETFDYRQNVTRFDSTTDDFLTLRKGVCQDFAHLMLGFLRLRGIPCRYVSGYVHVDRAGKTPSQSHAWIEFWAPLAGWVPFDPTHDQMPDERYVVVGHGRNYDDVPPNRGIYRGSAREMLSAEVVTEKVTRRGASASFQEEIVAIDLPVYAEVPKYRPEGPRTAEDAAAEEQQQQQQQ